MRLTDIFKKQKNQTSSHVIQSSRPISQPFSIIDNYSPSASIQLSLYKQLREAIPVIDAAIYKLIRLIGLFEIKCDNKSAEKMMNSFFKTVPVGGNSNGINTFVSNYLESLLTYGTAVGEIIVSKGGFFYGLYNTSLSDVSFKRNKNGFNIDICDCTGTKVSNPQFVFMTSLNPEPGQICGNSILKGLPFVSSILLKIYNTIGINWDRVGNVRFAVTYKPQNDASDKSFARERAEQIAQEWSKMQNSSAIKDFIAVGDVDIKVIGADNQILDSQVPARQMLEQIIAKTGLPPFILGLSWSTTERMSSQQADILTSELEYYRGLLEPVLIKICNTYLRMNGYSCEAEIKWSDIMLQDLSEISDARLKNANALKIEQEVEKEELHE